MNTLNIALVSKFYFPITGGVSSDTFNLAEALVDLGHDVTVFSPFYSALFSQSAETFEVIRLPVTNRFRTKVDYFLRHPTLSGFWKAKIQDGFYKELSEFLKRRNYDVIHSRGIGCHALEINPAKRVKRVETFGTMPTARSYNIFDKALNSSFSKIDYKVAIWLGLAKPLWRFASIKIDRIIENGVDSDFFSPTQRKETDYFTIGTVLNFAYKRKVYGLKILLQAFSEIYSRRKDIKLKIVGDGPLRNDVEEMVNSLNATSKQNVFLLGRLDYCNMPSFYNSLDLFTHISFQDAAPNTLLEAMSCGVPVMANNIGFVPRVVDKDTGWIVKPTADDAYTCLKSIVDLNASTLKDRGEEARRRIKNNFSWKKTALEYLKLYNDGT